MYTFTHTIADPSGIHARPAGLIVKEAGKHESKITITKGEKTVDARRLISLMSLGIKCGETVTVQVEGADEATAGPAFETFFKEQTAE